MRNISIQESEKKDGFKVATITIPQSIMRDCNLKKGDLVEITMMSLGIFSVMKVGEITYDKRENNSVQNNLEQEKTELNRN